MFNSLRPHELQHLRIPCPSLPPGICSNSCPLSQWRHPTISSSVVPSSSCSQSFTASGSFPVSWLFASGDQSIEASASASVLPMQDWFPLGLIGLILTFKGLSRIFSSNTVWRHQFFSAQPSLWSNCHVSIWLLEKQAEGFLNGTYVDKTSHYYFWCPWSREDKNTWKRLRVK